MPLSNLEIRILGVLVEKERTTPEGYPLSTGALQTGCNQLTNRDPVTNYHLQEVREGLQRLRDRGLATTIQGVSDRVPKHQHLLRRAWDLDATEVALLAVSMLRGAQTAAELRARSSRYGGIPDVAEVEGVLARLSQREVPLVRCERAPGQSQDRWLHTLGGAEDRLQPRVRQEVEAGAGGAVRSGSASEALVAGTVGAGAATTGAATTGAATTDAADWPAAIAALQERIGELEQRIALLEARWREFA
jgi:uncharacterized protein